MNLTFTDYPDKTHHKPYELDGVLRILKNEGVILFPTDTVWSLGCDATDLDAINRLLHLKSSKDPLHYEILVDSVERLKSAIRHLHPRLETLLLYHQRPLSVMIEKRDLSPGYFPLNHPFLTFRIVKDDYCENLIRAFDKPLLTTAAATGDNNIPTSFSAIQHDLAKRVDYIVKRRMDEDGSAELSVMVKLSNRDELVFLRD